MSDFRIAIDQYGQKHKIYEVITSMRALGWEWFVLKKPGKGFSRFGFVQSPIVPEGEFGSFDLREIPSPTLEKQGPKATALPPQGWRWAPSGKKNPTSEGDIWNDTIRVLEYKFQKPYSRFNDREHQFLDRLFRKASDNRISLKIYPTSNPRKKKRRSVGVQDDKRLALNPPSIVKTKADETKWRRAVRSTERRFKKKEKDFKERQWRYAMGTFKRMKNI